TNHEQDFPENGLFDDPTAPLVSKTSLSALQGFLSAPGSRSGQRYPFSPQGCLSPIRPDFCGNLQATVLVTREGNGAGPTRPVTAYANFSRYHPPIAGHAMGTQTALIPHHVRHRLGSRILAAARRAR